MLTNSKGSGSVVASTTAATATNASNHTTDIHSTANPTTATDDAFNISNIIPTVSVVATSSSTTTAMTSDETSSKKICKNNMYHTILP